MDTNADSEIDEQNSTSELGMEMEEDEQEIQTETFSIPQNNIIDAVSVASSQSENDPEMMMVPETSGGRRRRKQQTPQRCSRVTPGLPHAAQFEPVTEINTDTETEFDICNIQPLLSDGQDDETGASSEDPPQIEFQPTSLNHYRQQKRTKTGFYFKKLHRPYFKKVSKGVVRSQPHQCADCGQKFPLRESLLKHISIIHTVKVHQCSFCGKQYRIADSLRKHIKRDHSGETHHCVLCDKYFTSKESLKQHWRIHSGEKPYRCDLCSLQFRYRHNYNQHLRTHSGIMEICEFCGKQYNRRDSLIKHIKKTHGEDSSHSIPLSDHEPGSSEFKNGDGSPLANGISRLFHFCRKCSLSFTTRQALLSHMQRSHHKVILVCPICKLQYHLRDSLRKHVKNVHHMKLKDERNTRAEIEVRRLLQIPDSRVMVPDLEPDGTQVDSNEKNQPRSDQLQTSTKVSETALYPHIAKLKKCPFCDRYYRLRDSLREHIKSCHMKGDNDSEETKIETDKAAGNVLNNFLTGGSQFLPESLPNTSQEGNSSTSSDKIMQKLESSQILDNYTNISSDLSSHDMMDLFNSPQSEQEDEAEDVTMQAHDGGDDLSSNSKNSISRNQHGKLLCLTCGAQYEDDSLFNIHIASHPTCAVCQKQYTLRDSLRHHIKRSHPGHYQEMIDRKNRQKGSAKFCTKMGEFAENAESDPSGKITFRCVVCYLCFQSQEELDIHGKKHKSCPYCPKQYELRDSLRRHMQSAHPAEYWEKRLARNKDKSCPYCPKHYNRNDSLRRHMQSAHPAEYLEERRAKSKKSLNNNKFELRYESSLEVHKEKGFDEMADCSKESGLTPTNGTHLSIPVMNHADQEPLENYQSVHHEDVSAGNDVSELNQLIDSGGQLSCSHEFENDELRAKHLSQCTACPYCSKQYCLRDSLRKHIRRSHATEFEADGLTTRILLKNSMMTNQLNCSACDQTFKTPLDLEEHESSHLKCEYCGQLYVLRESLRKHIYRKHADIHNELKGMNPDARFVWNEASVDAVDESNSYSKPSRLSGEDERSFDAHQSGVEFSNSSMDQDNKVLESATSGQDMQGETADNIKADSLGDPRFSNVFPCSACMIVFDNSEALAVHIQSHLPCHICGKLYTLRDSLRKHIKRSHPEEYNAMIEEKQQKKIAELADFAKICDSENGAMEQENGPLNDGDMVMKNLCYVCFIQFESDDLYENHAKTHPACPHCGKMYRLRDSLNKHVQRSHPTQWEAERENKMKAKMDAIEKLHEEMNIPKPKPQPLNIDVKQLTGGFVATSNNQENIEEKEYFPCTACLRVFKTQDLLDEHMQTHPDCPHCGKRYKLLDSLRKHMKRSHPAEEEERRLILSKTDERDGIEQQAYNLKQGQYENESTNDQENLVEDQLFPCTACPEVYETQDDLTAHIQTHPSCPHCGRYYRLIDSLRRHIKRSHPVEEEERRLSLPKEDSKINTAATSSYAPKLSNSKLAGPVTNSSKPVSAAPVDVLFPCPACSMIFYTKGALRAHASEHLSCPYCGRLYSVRNSMRKHIQRSHPVEYEAEKLNGKVNSYSTAFYDKFDDNPLPSGDDDGNHMSDSMEPPVVPKIEYEICDSMLAASDDSDEAEQDTMEHIPKVKTEITE